MKDLTRRRAGDNDVTAGFLLSQQALVNLDGNILTKSGASVINMPNQGTGGSDYDPNVPVGTGANLRESISDACLMYGASGDYASTPDSAAASITGDIDIRAKIALDDWTPAALSTIVSKYDAVNEKSYLLTIAPSGVITMFTNDTGSGADESGSSTAATGFSDTEAGWVRATLDVDNGAGGRTYTFYTSSEQTDDPDEVTWTQLGATVTTAGSTSLFDGAAVLGVGAYANGTTGRLNGSIYRAQIYNGIDGTLAVDFNAADYVNKASDTTFNSNLMAANLPGASGDYVSTPDSAASSITGDIDIRVRVALDDFTPAADQELVAKYESTGDLRSYALRLDSTGPNLVFLVSTDGTAANTTTFTSNAAVSGATDGVAFWIRVTLDADNGSSNSDCTFYTSTTDTNDPAEVVWVQLGDVQNGGSTLSIDDNSSVLEVGSRETGTLNNAEGSFRRVAIYNGIDGTLAVSFDAQDFVTGSTLTSSDTGEVWTANGNAAFTGQWTLNGDTFIQNTGNSAITTIGSAALETTAGQDIATFTRALVVRFTAAAPAADQVLFDARSDTLKSVSLYSDDSNADKWTLDGGTALALTEAYDTDWHVIMIRYSADANTTFSISSVGSATGDAGSETLDYGTLMAAFGGGSTAKILLTKDLIWNRILSDSEVSSVESYLLSDNSI